MVYEAICIDVPRLSLRAAFVKVGARDDAPHLFPLAHNLFSSLSNFSAPLTSIKGSERASEVTFGLGKTKEERDEICAFQKLSIGDSYPQAVKLFEDCFCKLKKTFDVDDGLASKHGHSSHV